MNSAGRTRGGEAYEALTFDCYGTLIDWYGGVRTGARKCAALADLDIERFVRDRDAADRELILGPYRPYSEIVAESARRAAALQRRELDQDSARAFAAGMTEWPPFEESRDALARLEKKFRLGILSNVDTQVLAASVALLGAHFEVLVTAQRVRSYKPGPAHWHRALAELDLPAARVLHVGCSLFHDMGPAHALGFPTAFVDREREGLGVGDRATFLVPDLNTLCELLLES